MSGTAGYLRSTSANGTLLASTPDTAALSITGDIDIRCLVSMDDWTPTQNTEFVTKWGAAGQRSFHFGVESGAGGRARFTWSSDGTSQSGSGVGSALPATDGGIPIWVRAAFDVNNGSGGWNIYTYWAPWGDDPSWTSLGSSGAGGVQSIFDSTAPIEIATENGGATNSGSGAKIYRVQIRNNINNDGSGIVFDASFNRWPIGTTSFVEDSSNHVTVTINTASALIAPTRATAATVGLRPAPFKPGNRR